MLRRNWGWRVDFHRRVAGIMAGVFPVGQSKAILAQSCEVGKRPAQFGNETVTAESLPSIAADFESSASANSARPTLDSELLF